MTFLRTIKKATAAVDVCNIQLTTGEFRNNWRIMNTQEIVYHRESVRHIFHKNIYLET